MFRELTILSDVCLAAFLLGCEAFSTGEGLSPSWLKYNFFVFRSHWYGCSVTFLSVGQFGFGVIGDAGFYVLLYVDRLHLLVPVLGTHFCGGSPWYLYLTTSGLLWKGGSGSKMRVPLFPIAYQYLCCSFQAWALHVDVSRANHSFRCRFGSFLTWLWSFSNRWVAVTFLVEIHLFCISLSLICL